MTCSHSPLRSELLNVLPCPWPIRPIRFATTPEILYLYWQVETCDHQLSGCGHVLRRRNFVVLRCLSLCLFWSRKLMSSLPFLRSLNSSSSVNGLFRSMTSITDSCNGRGPYTFSNERSLGLGYRRTCCGSFSSKPLREFLVPCVVFGGYARTNSFHCFIKVSP